MRRATCGAQLPASRRRAPLARSKEHPMRRFKWLSRGKKSTPEPRCEPPIWLGNRSNGEYYFPETTRDRLVRKLILQRADENARRLGMERREFLATSMGMATSLWALNVVGCSTDSSAGPRSGRDDAGSGGAGGQGGADQDAGFGQDGGYCLPEEAQLDE